MKGSPYFIIQLLLLLLLIQPFSGSCQETGAETTGTSFRSTIQPLHLINRTVKVDLEVKRPDKKLSYVLSPEIFAGEVYDRSLLSFKKAHTDVLSGFGLGIQQKISGTRKASGPYLAYGITYRNLAIKYQDQGFVPFTKDGLDYFEYGEYDDKVKINNFIITAQPGVQAITRSNIIFDFFVGFGYKFSSQKSRFGACSYAQSMSSYAYNGGLIQLGFKLGYKIK